MITQQTRIPLFTPQPLAPILKWPGGKSWIVPILGPYLEADRDRPLIELFCGAAAVTLAARPGRGQINDANRHLIALYRHIAAGSLYTAATAAIPTHPDPETYNRNRDRFNALIDSGDDETPTAAYLFYYLNRAGFNGLVRYNRAGFYNVPCGNYGRPPIETPAALDRAYRPALEPLQITAGDFADVEIPPGAAVFADPPYDGGFTSYTPAGFDWEDQQRLIARLARHPGPVAITNADTPRIRALYAGAGYKIESLQAPRSIAAAGESRGAAAEILATRNWWRGRPG